MSPREVYQTELADNVRGIYVKQRLDDGKGNMTCNVFIHVVVSSHES